MSGRGRSCISGVAWTAEDNARLRAAFEAGGIQFARASFPERTPWSVRQRMARMRLLTRPRWTPEEDEMLRRLWGSEPLVWICRHLKRGPGSVCDRAVNKLGLPAGCPQGMEYLSKSAERCGYATSQLRRILKWAGVGIWTSFAKKHGKRRPRHIVDPFDVDRAVERWHKTECLEVAARNRGVSYRLILSMLRDAGVTPERIGPLRDDVRGTRSKGERRIPTELLDRLFRERLEFMASTINLCEAAKKYRVSRCTMSYWLRGHGTMRGREHRYDKKLVRQIVRSKGRSARYEDSVQAAKRLNVCVRTLNQWRQQDLGPRKHPREMFAPEVWDRLLAAHRGDATQVAA